MSSQPRYFPNPINTSGRASLKSLPNPHQELLSSLTRLTTHYPPVHTCSTGRSFHGLYYGPTSVAYLFYRLSRLYGSDVEFRQQSFVDWAEAYLALGGSSSGGKDKVNPSHCGIANETLAHLAVTALLRRDKSIVRKICAFEGVINAPGDGGSDEWLYGRAGYLYFLRLCREAVNDDEGASISTAATTSSSESSSGTAALIETTIQNTIARILTTPQPWRWHGKEYLGAVHGSFGILTQIMLSLPPTTSSGASSSKIAPLLVELIDRQYSESGNFPSSTGSESDELVQFCHGGPGVIVSLHSLRSHVPGLKNEIDDAIAKAQEDMWRRGLLTKRPCLCRGIAGNALALPMDNEEEREKFLNFLSFMGSENMERVEWLRDEGEDTKDEFAGLYTGEAGCAWVWAVADLGGRDGACIGYNDV